MGPVPSFYEILWKLQLQLQADIVDGSAKPAGTPYPVVGSVLCPVDGEAAMVVEKFFCGVALSWK